ncbi:MAG: hypothetical protein ETSY2_09805 [Candidatus Entotheonella gemina]|uniref:Beta-lactamase-related domain-containing protein n=1 Tax=Candidatus Entotheonella gemina TaxID=1429439 RepID=W4MBU6_9BACT|nr:MAG: hypothetical protein ETSY2_09805 [Candidatus Entotheonella gemina]
MASEAVRRLIEFVQPIQKRHHLPWVQMALVRRHGEMEAVELPATEKTQPFQPGDFHIYPIACLTKLVTSLAVLRLRDQGHIALDDKLSAFLPEVVRPTYDPRLAAVTVRQLLSHTSGLPFGGYDCQRRDESDPAHLFSWARLFSTPGERVKYSDVGYITLGHIIEAVTGHAVASHLKEDIVRPLGLNASGFQLAECDDQALLAREMPGYHG